MKRSRLGGRRGGRRGGRWRCAFVYARVCVRARVSLCVGGCTRVCCRLQAYVLQARLREELECERRRGEEIRSRGEEQRELHSGEQALLTTYVYIYVLLAC